MSQNSCVIVCIIMLSLSIAAHASGPVLIDRTSHGSRIISGQKGLSADTPTTTPTGTPTPTATPTPNPIPTPTYTATSTPTATPVPITIEEMQDYLLSRSIIQEGDKSRVDVNQDSLVDIADMLWLIVQQNPTPTPLPDEIIILLPDDVPLILLRVPAGSFLMGSPVTERSRDSDEGPAHTVNIGYDFYMGKTEITQKQWLAVMDSWPGTPPSSSYGVGGNYPAYNISWDDATNFITALNTHIVNTDQGPLTVRLPSEAEWEYACRAGTQTRFFFGDSLDCGDVDEDCAAGKLPGNRSDYMWYWFNCQGNADGAYGSKPLGTKPPRSEERRVGKECRLLCRSRWSPYH